MSKYKTISQKLAEKTIQELAQPKKPKARSRVWENPQGYKFLVPWSNAVLLRYLVRLFTRSLPKSEYRRKAQIDDAARSVVRNIEEGYKRATTGEYLQFLGFSQGSLEEVKGDIRESTENGFLKSGPGTSLAGLGINLKDFNQSLRGNKKGYQHLTILYPPLKKVRAQDLSYEIFFELINKTDWLLRKLVESLEKKLNQDQKAYQIERARIKSNLRRLR